MDVKIRKATQADKDYIIEAIIEAEKGGHELISYCYIFSITEAEFRDVLGKMLDEDIEGQEFCISDYLIAEVDGNRAATAAGWVELENGIASSIIKSNLLMHFMDREAILKAAPYIKLMSEMDVQRSPGALQIESTYTSAAYRGMGLYARLINEHIRIRKENGSIFDSVQVVVLKSNVNPFRALSKLGFTNVMERQASNKEIFNIFASDTKVLMEKKLALS